ncbi:hypothetical protein Bca4012_066717 [Brassica carinata]
MLGSAPLQRSFFSGGLSVSLWLRRGGGADATARILWIVGGSLLLVYGVSWLGIEALGPRVCVRLGRVLFLLAWCVLVDPFTTAASYGFEHAVGLVLKLSGWLALVDGSRWVSRIQGVSIWDLALVLHSILALVSDSSSSTSSVRRFSATSSVWWFSCLWPPLQTFGLLSHPSTTWDLLELLWWCAWQLCAGWAQFMEYGGCSPFARFDILCRSFPGLINARSGC